MIYMMNGNIKADISFRGNIAEWIGTDEELWSPVADITMRTNVTAADDHQYYASASQT